MSLLADSRIFVWGGFNGQDVYEDVHILDLAGSGYLAQVSEFRVAERQSIFADMMPQGHKLPDRP